MARAFSAAVLLLLSSRAALAHPRENHAAGAEGWWTGWNGDPLLLLLLALTGGIYFFGLKRIWQRAGPGKSLSRGQAAAFAGGVLALAAALVSPVDNLSAELSWVHMVQHMILMMIAAPLLVLGQAGFVALWALPLGWRQTIGGWGRRLEIRCPRWYSFWQPITMWSLFAVGLWIWHVPALYEGALKSRLAHDAQHLTFFATSYLFWRVLLDPVSRMRLSRGLGVIFLFTTSLHATALGVFIALSPRVWYPAYEQTAPAWNLTALEDQQLAGLIMWMPGCMVYAAAAAILFALWLQEPEPKDRGALWEPR